MKSFAEHSNGVRWRMRAMRRLWSADVEPNMPFLAPLPVSAVGKIEAPAAGEALPNPFTVSGYVAFKACPTARVELWIGDTSLGPARLGLPRPDFADSDISPHAGTSGFELTAELDPVPGGEEPLTLRAVATGIDGETHELEPIEVMPPEPAAPGNRLRPLAETTRRPTGTGLRTLVYTHQLNLGGAQLYLLDLLRQLHRQSTIDPVVVSAMDGVVREELEDIGIPVHITSPVPCDDASTYLGRLEEFVNWARPFEFELALVNTATGHTVSGADAAARLGIPVLWAIHESLPPAIGWGGFDPAVFALGERALAGAAFTIFEADATRKQYEALLDPSRSVTLPYGLDLTPIERTRERFDPVAFRRAAELPDDAEVILSVGTIEPRKAQISLAVAFDQVAARHPNAHLVFVGGRDDFDSRALRDRIDASPWRERIRLEPITPDVLPWYALADLFVCASDVESLPRTVLEAMALETPVLATEVFGLPELIDHGKTGWLCEQRDISALAGALDEVLSTPREERAAIGKAARALVEERHSLERYGREVAELIARAVGSEPDPSTRHVATP